MTTSPRTGSAKPSRIPPAEWLVAALSALLILGAVGFLALRAGRPATLPDLVAAVDSIVQGDTGWMVRVRVENHGDRTAAAVQIEGVLGGADERSGFTLDFVAGRSARRGALLFAGDPRTHRLTLRVLGYADP